MEITDNTKNCLGQCPHCGSENIDYQACKILDETLRYPAACEECGGEFYEDYNITYYITAYNSKE